MATKVGLDVMLKGGTTPSHAQALVDSIQRDLKAKNINVPDDQVVKGKFINIYSILSSNMSINS